MTTDSKQKKGIRNTVITIVIIISVILILFTHKFLSPRLMSNDELRVNGAIVFEHPRIISDFNLVDHNGEAFSVENLKGKWTLAYFGFAHCPDICPMTLATLDSVYDKLSDDIREDTQVVLFSLDPARDTPEKLAEYVPFFNKEFIGVTGEFMEILKLSRNVNVAFNKVTTDDGYTVDHTGHIVLINKDGHYQGFFKPPFTLARLKSTFTSIAVTHD